MQNIRIIRAGQSFEMNLALSCFLLCPLDRPSATAQALVWERGVYSEFSIPVYCIDWVFGNVLRSIVSRLDSCNNTRMMGCSVSLWYFLPSSLATIFVTHHWKSLKWRLDNGSRRRKHGPMLLHNQHGFPAACPSRSASFLGTLSKTLERWVIGYYPCLWRI